MNDRRFTFQKPTKPTEVAHISHDHLTPSPPLTPLQYSYCATFAILHSPLTILLAFIFIAFTSIVEINISMVMLCCSFTHFTRIMSILFFSLLLLFLGCSLQKARKTSRLKFSRLSNLFDNFSSFFRNTIVIYKIKVNKLILFCNSLLCFIITLTCQSESDLACLPKIAISCTC